MLNVSKCELTAQDGKRQFRPIIPSVCTAQTLVHPLYPGFVPSCHRGDWLCALPISACGLKLDDEAIRVGVGRRLVLNLCVPYQCRY